MINLRKYPTNRFSGAFFKKPKIDEKWGSLEMAGTLTGRNANFNFKKNFVYRLAGTQQELFSFTDWQELAGTVKNSRIYCKE